MPPAEKSAAEDKAAEDKAKAQHAGANEAAQSVAEAVKKVADAAVAAVQKSKVVGRQSDFTFSGTPGGRFRIDGAGFSTGGTLTVGGRPVATTGWGSTHIEGTLPADVPAGEVVVQVDEKTRQTGHFDR